MERARYIDPKRNAVLQKERIVLPRVLCVVPFFVPRNKVKNYGYFSENKHETIQLTLSAHRKFKPGVYYDILVVNNDTEDVAILDWLEQHNFWVEKRENIGYGFGAWKYAWENYKDYDYYLFTEDDILPTKDGWLKEIVDKFEEENDTGAVGNFIEARSRNENGSTSFWGWLDYDRDSLYSFDGAFTFTSSQVLKQVDEHGGLKVLDCMPRTNIWATANEVGFQQPILELGYEIRSFADSNHTVIHGSEIFTGDVRYWGKEMCPLVNSNGRHKIEDVKKLIDTIQCPK